MQRYMFFLTLAQWCIAKMLEEPIPGMAFRNETVPALMAAYSELNVARECGETDFVPASKHCYTQLSDKRLEMLEGWIPK